MIVHRPKSFLTSCFAVDFYGIGHGDCRTADRKRDRCGRMLAQLDGDRMIGQNGKVDIFSLLQRFKERDNDFCIKIFDRLEFQFQVPQMGTLIHSLNMQIDKIVCFQSF